MDELLKNQQTTPLQTIAKQTKTQKTLVALLFMCEISLSFCHPYSDLRSVIPNT